jgi:uncharacterized protein
MIEHGVSVDTDMGKLNGILATPDDGTRISSGLVLVDGSGPATRHVWGEMPRWFAESGVATLRHDKPGCGGSPGDWREQTFADRAAEAIAATTIMRAELGPRSAAPVGLIGYSQGGWISLLAAATYPADVDFVVTVSGPGVGPTEQERVRVERLLRRSHDEATVRHAMRWVDERATRLALGEPPEQVLRSQRGFADQPWYATVAEAPYADVEEMRFVARSATFDPASVVPHLRCPILALFGGADELVPVERSVAVLAERLPALRRGSHGIAVFPGADHMLYVDEPRPGVERHTQLAPGFLPMLGDFLARISHEPYSRR